MFVWQGRDRHAAELALVLVLVGATLTQVSVRAQFRATEVWTALRSMCCLSARQATCANFFMASQG
jgi:hypothetical protein